MSIFDKKEVYGDKKLLQILILKINDIFDDDFITIKQFNNVYKLKFRDLIETYIVFYLKEIDLFYFQKKHINKVEHLELFFNAYNNKDEIINEYFVSKDDEFEIEFLNNTKLKGILNGIKDYSLANNLEITEKVSSDEKTMEYSFNSNVFFAERNRKWFEYFNDNVDYSSKNLSLDFFKKYFEIIKNTSKEKSYKNSIKKIGNTSFLDDYKKDIKNIEKSNFDQFKLNEIIKKRYYEVNFLFTLLEENIFKEKNKLINEVNNFTEQYDIENSKIGIFSADNFWDKHLPLILCYKIRNEWDLPIFYVFDNKSKISVTLFQLMELYVVDNLNYLDLEYFYKINKNNKMSKLELYFNVYKNIELLLKTHLDKSLVKNKRIVWANKTYFEGIFNGINLYLEQNDLFIHNKKNNEFDEYMFLGKNINFILSQIEDEYWKQQTLMFFVTKNVSEKLDIFKKMYEVFSLFLKDKKRLSWVKDKYKNQFENLTENYRKYYSLDEANEFKNYNVINEKLNTDIFLMIYIMIFNQTKISVEDKVIADKTVELEFKEHYRQFEEIKNSDW